MTKAKVSKKMNVPADRAWSILSDFGNIGHFHPHVSRAPILSDIEMGIGAVRRCEFYNESSIVETVIAWKEGESITVRLSEFNMPFSYATATFHVAEIDTNNAEVSFEMDFTVKFGLLGNIMGVIMVRPMMKKMFNEVLSSLDLHARTGQMIGEHGKPCHRLAPC